MIRLLTSKGMKVRAFDPEAVPNSRDALASNTLVEIIDDQYEVLEKIDALDIVTDWKQFGNPDLQRCLHY